jgi:hypothetical protein
MPPTGELVGRERELAVLVGALDEASADRGGLVLLAGEAGIGKTRLAEEALSRAGVRVLRARTSPEGAPPFDPIASVLRAFLRLEPHGLAVIGVLEGELAVLLPELGAPLSDGSGAGLLEALRRAFEEIARRGPTAILLDDLHWADETTLAEVLSPLGAALGETSLLVIGVYRSDEIARGHPIRRLRRDLRRAGRLRELVLEPLDAESTAARRAGPGCRSVPGAGGGAVRADAGPAVLRRGARRCPRCGRPHPRGPPRRGRSGPGRRTSRFRTCRSAPSRRDRSPGRRRCSCTSRSFPSFP